MRADTKQHREYAHLIDFMEIGLTIMIMVVVVGLVLQIDRITELGETSKTQIERLEQRITTLEQKTINAEAYND